MNQNTDENSTVNAVSDVNATNIRIMVRVKTILETPYNKDNDPEYLQIVKLVNTYIETKCQHQVVYDWIDTTPDDSKMIQYCIHCYKTFV